MNSKSNYKTILPELRMRITSGVYGVGMLMPSENELATEFSVSRPTISKVLSQLLIEQLVVKKRGVGTMVAHDGIHRKELTIGLLLPGAGESEIFAAINNQIFKLSEQLHFKCLWDGTTANNANTRRVLIENCCNNYIQQGVDGILFSPLERVKDADVVNQTICERINAAGIPMVLIDRDVVPFPDRSRYDVVGLDNYNAGVIMARHMIEAGCKNIYFFSRPFSAYSVKSRLMAVSNTVIEAGLDFYKWHHICDNPEDLNVVRNIPIIKGQTGIICCNDATSVVLMSSLYEIGYICGEDYLMAGFDDMKYSQYLKCPLTSFVQPCDDIGNVSVDLLLRRISDKSRPAITALLNGQLAPRESTKSQLVKV